MRTQVDDESATKRDLKNNKNDTTNNNSTL